MAVCTAALAKLGDGNLYTKIRECNGLTSNIIRVGMKLLIP
ncbi:MAG: LysM peptidoglycan-binding domain-containing protein [Butyricicoccus sp.]